MTSNGSLYLKQMEIGPMENFVYFVGDFATKEALVVDPAWDADAIFKAAEADGFTIKGALITHTHFDHVNGLETLLHRADIHVYVHKNEAEFLKGMKSHVKKVSGGDKIKIGRFEIDLLHTPGHTPGSQCFLIDRNLISGDTLFINACGRCDLPGGSAAAMYESLKRLASLDPNTVLYPGHNYAETPVSTMGEEKQHNPYLQSMDLEHFLQFRMGW